MAGFPAVPWLSPPERIPFLMLPDAVLPVPASLMTLLTVFSSLFTAPSFRTFADLACGFLAQGGKRTVCGMLSGAGLARLWPHDRAHWFFARARWDADDLGLAAARLVVSLLVPPGAPVDVAIDDTLFKRRGKKVWAACALEAPDCIPGSAGRNLEDIPGSMAYLESKDKGDRSMPLKRWSPPVSGAACRKTRAIW